MISAALNVDPAIPATLDLPRLMRRVADYSVRPRYTFMVLDLICRVATPDGRAGPFVHDGAAMVPIREWLADALAPVASRHHRRIAAVDRTRAQLQGEGRLPGDAAAADAAIAEEMGDRVRASGMTAVSRAVTELASAGLVERHYQGYRIDHRNRGAQRLAVYTVPPAVRAALDSGSAAGGRAPRLL